MPFEITLVSTEKRTPIAMCDDWRGVQQELKQKWYSSHMEINSKHMGEHLEIKWRD